MTWADQNIQNPIVDTSCPEWAAFW